MKAAPSYAAVSGTNFLISLQLKHGSESLGPKHFCNGESHAAFKVSLFVGYNYGLRVIFQERNYETCESSLTSVFRRPSCKQKIIARVFLFIGSSKAKKHLFEAGNRRIVFSARRDSFMKPFEPRNCVYSQPQMFVYTSYILCIRFIRKRNFHFDLISQHRF